MTDIETKHQTETEFNLKLVPLLIAVLMITVLTFLTSL